MNPHLTLGLFLFYGGCEGTNKSRDDRERPNNQNPLDDTGEDTGAETGVPPGDPPCSDHNNLLVIPLDIWGGDLAGGLNIDAPHHSLEDLPPGAQWISLDENPMEIQIELRVVDYLEAKVTVNYWGGFGEDAFAVGEMQHEGRRVGGGAQMTIDGKRCPVYRLFVGAEHKWFASSAPAPTKNKVDLLIDGEEFWSEVHLDILEAEERITWSTWWWESAFELTRSPFLGDTVQERAANTVMSVFALQPTVDHKILINRFWGENFDWTATLNTDESLRNAAAQAGDPIDVMLQGNTTIVPVNGIFTPDPMPWSFAERVWENPRYANVELNLRDDRQLRDFFELDAASWHQKGIVIDGRVAFVTGFNTSGTDWDDVDHLVFNPLRMDITASEEERLAVYWGETEPTYVPRRDMGIRLEGPGVYEVEKVFHQRWEQSMAEDLLYSENVTSFSLSDPPEEQGDILLQVSVTHPEPYPEMAIFDAHKQAIEAAESSIIIEDQYFRAPMLNDVILQRMRAEPDLYLTVITNPISTLDLGLKYTHFSDIAFKMEFPNRYQVFQMRTAALVLEEGVIYDDVYFYDVPIYLHTKLRIVDDRWLSVGSCNMNNRGYKFEGELNVSVLDRDWVRNERRRILAEYVGYFYADYLSDDPENNFAVLQIAAEDNESVFAYWNEWGEYLSLDEADETWDILSPSGFLHPLTFSDDYFEVGPDLF